MNNKIVHILIVFLLQFNLASAFAQYTNERVLRDMQDSIKKFDEQQRNFGSAPSKLNTDEVVNTIFWIIAAAIILAVGSAFILRKSDESAAIKALSKKGGYDYVGAALLAPLTKDEVLGMTVDEIAKKVSQHGSTIKIHLRLLGWSTKDFDGAKEKALAEKLDAEVERLIETGLGKEEAYSSAKEKQLYERKLKELMEEEAKISKSDLPLHLTLYAEQPKQDLFWHTICLDEKGNVVRGYKLFSDFISESDVPNGFKNGKNISFETLKNPADFVSNVTINLYRKKFPAKAKYVGIFISSNSKYDDDSKYHRSIKLEYATDGFFSDYTTFVWSVDAGKPSQIFLGLVDLLSNPKASFIPAYDLKLEVSDDYILKNGEDKSLLISFQKTAVQLINKNS